MKRFLKFLWQEDAATAVEYAVMLALILLVAIGAISSFGSETGGMWGYILTQLRAAGFIA
jgi:Flp pilus assembly pilin Flp